MPEIRCPDCRETMEIELDWYGRRVSCPTCQYNFTAEFPSSRSSRDDDFEDDRPRRRRSRFRDEEERPKSSNKGLFITLGIIGGVLLLAVCGCGGWGFWMFNAPVQYSSAWITHSLPDGSASIQFPKSPRTDPIGDATLGTSGNNYVVEEKFPKDAAFSFGYCDYANGTSGELDEIIASVRDEMKKELSATIQSDTTTTINGLSVRDITFDYGRGTAITRFIKLTSRGKPRIVMLTAGGRNVQESDRKKFFDSFQLAAGKK